MLPVAHQQVIEKTVGHSISSELYNQLSACFAHAFESNKMPVSLCDVPLDSVASVLLELKNMGWLSELGRMWSLGVRRAPNGTLTAVAEVRANGLSWAIEPWQQCKMQARLVYSDDEFEFKGADQVPDFTEGPKKGSVEGGFVSISVADRVNTYQMSAEEMTAALADTIEQKYGHIKPPIGRHEYAMCCLVRRALKWFVETIPEHHTEIRRRIYVLLDLQNRYFDEFRRHQDRMDNLASAHVSSRSISLDQETPAQLHLAKLRDEYYETHAYGKRTPLTQPSTTPVIAVVEDPVQAVEMMECNVPSAVELSPAEQTIEPDLNTGFGTSL
ncbi:hypothetical protein IC617_08270 [Neiella sp. HB171785]|uniref:Uncharacterized protein n=1 Tax=Neiella litorisoli TaxID=2771431 RepID=A0A8J6QRL5_9GAMM|nr:hypothetical protein [Neiella litorisoli]MBD1389419.1 hypothetical protein [Neiella litorisoli]